MDSPSQGPKDNPIRNGLLVSEVMSPHFTFPPKRIEIPQLAINKVPVFDKQKRRLCLR